MAKLYDVMIKTGEYKNANGETKGRYENVGAVMENENGPFLVLKPWIDYKQFSKDGRIMCSLFKDEPRQQTQQQPAKLTADQIPF